MNLYMIFRGFSTYVQVCLNNSRNFSLFPQHFWQPCSAVVLHRISQGTICANIALIYISPFSAIHLRLLQSGCKTVLGLAFFLGWKIVQLIFQFCCILIISGRSSTFGLEGEVLLAYGVVTGVSDSIVVGFDEVDVGVKGGFDLFLASNLLLLLFPTILASILVLISCRLLLVFFQLSSQASMSSNPKFDRKYRCYSIKPKPYTGLLS